MLTGGPGRRITDASGSAVPAAKVVVENEESGLRRETQTNSDGLFQPTFLPIGPYVVMIEAKGFARARRQSTVELNSPKVLDFSLQLASVSTEVTVTDEAPIIETCRGDLKATIETRVIEDRPLSSRNILSLVEVLPGFQSCGGLGAVNNPTLSAGSSVSFNGTGTNCPSSGRPRVGFTRWRAGAPRDRPADLDFTNPHQWILPDFLYAPQPAAFRLGRRGRRVDHTKRLFRTGPVQPRSRHPEGLPDRGRTKPDFSGGGVRPHHRNLFAVPLRRRVPHRRQRADGDVQPAVCVLAGH